MREERALVPIEERTVVFYEVVCLGYHHTVPSAPNNSYKKNTKGCILQSIDCIMQI